MGIGPTKMDYKERDFTKQPLEKEDQEKDNAKKNIFLYN